MEFQLWTTSRLGGIDLSLRKALYFYAPLTDNLDFMGIEPATFARAGASSRMGRDGLAHAVAANVPRFEYNGEIARGLYLTSGETLQFSAQNGLDSANTLIWFEAGVAKSTPTNANPFSSAGIWTGNLDIHVAHIAKANRVLATSEISTIQTALADVAQSFPPPPQGQTFDPYVFVTEVPAGTRDGVNVTFTLSQTVNVDSILLAYGGLTLFRVASSPAEMEYTLSGTGNKTITMGLAPLSGKTFVCSYVTA